TIDKTQDMKETSFLQFGELPKEIRLAIWEAAIPGPRIVDLRDQPLKITAGELKDQIREQKEKMFGFHPMGGFKSKCPAPEILFACRESHEVATRYYERAF
ncbi:uncharacterized protein LY89DRAFT_542662, partial [Mollisia scopiformis]